jgi:prepilin-type N-terminal cleavage/methylation domain-containing protein
MRKGFTLIELLIVIAILGILAVVILIVMNPGERQAQARDTGRISSVVQLGRSLMSYYTTKTTLPDVSSWANELVTSGELASFPSGISYTYTRFCPVQHMSSRLRIYLLL